MNLIEKIEGVFVFRGGRHKGQKLEEVARTDPRYLRWLRNDNAAEGLSDEAFEKLEAVMQSYGIPLERIAYRPVPRGRRGC